MRPIPTSLTWTSPEFLVRLFASYLLVPLVAPVLMLVTICGSIGMSSGDWSSPRDWWLSGDWFGVALFYGIFSEAAMLVLGTPLLALYLCLGLTDFVSFMAAGGVCAGITAYVVYGGHVSLGWASFFATLGIISGAVFRLILFGAQTYTPASNQEVSE